MAVYSPKDNQMTKKYLSEYRDNVVIISLPNHAHLQEVYEMLCKQASSYSTLTGMSKNLRMEGDYVYCDNISSLDEEFLTGLANGFLLGKGYL